MRARKGSAIPYHQSRARLGHRTDPERAFSRERNQLRARPGACKDRRRMARAVWPVPWLLLSLAGGLLGCRSKRSPEVDASQPGASAAPAEAAAPKPSEPAGRCRQIGAGPGLRLGEPGPPRPATTEE